MTALIVDNDFWDLFPDAQIYTIELSGLNNQIPTDQSDYQTMLNNAEEEAKSFLSAADFKDNEIIADWRMVLTKFKKKKGARASIEALLKRVSQGRTFSPINPLVDIYNSISLEYGVLCGGEDLDKIVGPMHLGIAKGDEEFFPIGETKNDPPRDGEVIYYDEAGAICRSLNWRDGERTMLTEETTNAILIIEGITPAQKKRAEAAVTELRDKVRDYLRIEGKINSFTKNQ